MSGAEIQALHEHPSGIPLMKSWAGVKVSSVGPLATCSYFPCVKLVVQPKQQHFTAFCALCSIIGFILLRDQRFDSSQPKQSQHHPAKTLGPVRIRCAISPLSESAMYQLISIPLRPVYVRIIIYYHLQKCLVNT